jgi:regulatory protein
LAAVSLWTQAIRLLARREYARAELLHKLLAKGAEPDAARRLLDELAAQGYLSDARYAQATVAHHSRTLGRRRIAASLQAKGVARADIDTALAEAAIDDAAVLRALWQRRFGRAPVDERDKARQVRFLQARGFALSAILRLLRDCAAGAPE